MFAHVVESHLLLVLFFTGLLSGLVDAIAGGGGLISLPMLMSVGIPPHVALGTNKLQASVGTSVATYSYYKKKFLVFKTVYKGLLFGFVGTCLGAFLTQMLSSGILNAIIPFLLILILAYTIFVPSLGSVETPAKISEPLCFSIFGFLLGFYDGFFGPGTGSLWVFVLTFFLGYHFIHATAYAKVFNLKSNLFATVCFAMAGAINYHIAFWMAVGQMIGGWLGARLAMRRGAKLIRPIFLTMVTANIASLAYKNVSSIPLLCHQASDKKIVISTFAITLLVLLYFNRSNAAMRRKSPAPHGA